jgi:hypothetical protein
MLNKMVTQVMVVRQIDVVVFVASERVVSHESFVTNAQRQARAKTYNTQKYRHTSHHNAG